MCDAIGRAVDLAMSRRGFLKGAAGLAAAGAMPLWAKGADAKDLKARKEAAAASTAAAQGHNTRLVMLGTAGGPVWWPDCDREGISSAVVVGDNVYLVDCGESVGKRLKQAALGPLDKPGGLHGMETLRGIFLTHLHSDHTSDYFNLFLYGWYNGLTGVKQPVQVYGPGNRGELEPIFQLPGKPKSHPRLVNPDNPTPGTREMTDYLYQAFALDINDRMRDNLKPDLRDLVKVHDIALPEIDGFKSPNETPEPDMAPFKVYEDENVKVTATLVYHFPIWPAYAFRFDTPDGSVVFSGDTGPSKNLVRLASGADILVHEVIDTDWVDILFPPPISDIEESLKHHLLTAHTTIDDVGKVAEEAGVRSLVLSHIVPGNASLENLLRAQKDFSGQLIIGEDLMQLGVGAKAKSATSA